MEDMFGSMQQLVDLMHVGEHKILVRPSGQYVREWEVEEQFSRQKQQQQQQTGEQKLHTTSRRPTK